MALAHQACPGCPGGSALARPTRTSAARAWPAARHTRRTPASPRAAGGDGHSAPNAPPSPDATTRRSALARLAALPLVLAVPAARPRPAAAGDVQAVAEYLPPYEGEDGLFLFVPGPKKTPALRAAIVKPDAPYRFALPGSWREQKIANIQSGNYCQPRCEEPWTEVAFGDGTEGSLRVIVSPLRRLTPKAGAAIDAVGTVDGVIESLGPFITGTYLDPDDVVSAKAETLDGQLQYLYEVNATYGTVGPHSVAAVTTKGDLAFLFVLSATDKQWAKAGDKLRRVVRTFRA